MGRRVRAGAEVRSGRREGRQHPGPLLAHASLLPHVTGTRERRGAAAPPLTRENLGFLLAKASQRWNELLHERFAAAGYPDVRPAYGSLLIPLYEEDGLRQ